LGSSYPADLILDILLGHFGLIGSAKLANVPLSDVFGETAQTLQAAMEMFGIEYATNVLNATSALSFCVSHLPFEPNSGGWAPASPTTMESSLASFSAALAIPIRKGVETRLWASVTKGYFDPLGSALRAEIESKKIGFPGAAQMDANLSFFVTDKEYRLVDGAWPSRDAVLKLDVDTKWRDMKLQTGLELDSAEGWPYGLRAANPSCSPFWLAFQYWLPNSIKMELGFLMDHLAIFGNKAKASTSVNVVPAFSTNAVDATGAGLVELTKLDLAGTFQIEPVGTSNNFNLVRLRLGPKCSLSHNVSEDSEKDEDPDSEEENDEDSEAEDSGAEVSENASLAADLFLKNVGCLFALDWDFKSRRGGPLQSDAATNAGKLSFTANYHRGQENAEYWAFLFVLSQQVVISNNISGILAIRSPSGGWQTRPGKTAMPTVSLSLRMKSGP
jgi:hypothetical protein